MLVAPPWKSTFLALLCVFTSFSTQLFASSHVTPPFSLEGNSEDLWGKIHQVWNKISSDLDAQGYQPLQVWQLTHAPQDIPYTSCSLVSGRVGFEMSVLVGAGPAVPMMAVCKDSEQHVATLIPMIFDNATVGLRLGLGFRTFSGEIHHLDQKRLGSLFDWRYAGFGGAFSLGYGGYASVSWKAREEGEHGSKVKVNLYGGNVGFDLGAGVSGFQLSEVDFFIENWWIYEAAYRQYRMKEAALGWSEPLLSAKVMVAKEHQEHYQGPRFFASWVKYFPHSEDLGSDAQGRQLFAVARRIGQSAAGKMVFVKSTPSH